MITLKLVLLILAFVCFCIAAVGVATKINMIAAGLALWVLSLMVS